MSASGPKLIQGYKPTSFNERGVAIPFTTPQLAGARIRQAERTGTEFVVPNPSGGRGVYILHWGAVRQLFRPTVHDTILHQRVARLPGMDPLSVRNAARKVAAEGLAGREATIAANATIVAERNELVLTNFLLLIMLMEQVEPAGLRVSADTERTPELDRRARRLVTQVAASIGRTVAQVSADLESISAEYLPVGLDADMPCARLPKLTKRLEATARELSNWAKRFPDEASTGLAVSLSRSAGLTAHCARTALRTARDLTLDMPALLRTWAGTPKEIASQTRRTEWILDGWERFSLLWETAEHVSVQRAVLMEMAQLVPMLPREANEWGDEGQELEKLEPALRVAPINTSWRAGGAAHGLIARNERLQALIA